MNTHTDTTNTAHRGLIDLGAVAQETKGAQSALVQDEGTSDPNSKYIQGFGLSAD